MVDIFIACLNVSIASHIARSHNCMYRSKVFSNDKKLLNETDESNVSDIVISKYAHAVNQGTRFTNDM